MVYTLQYQPDKETRKLQTVGNNMEVDILIDHLMTFNKII